MSNMQAITAVILICVGICAYTDFRYKKIYNKVTGLMVLIGLMYHLVTSGPVGLGFSGMGLLTTAPLFILFALQILGAGDVKLMMALGVYFGSQAMLWIMLYSLVIAGVLSVVIMIMRKNLMSRMKVLGRYLLSILLLKKIMPYHNLKTEEEAHFPLAPSIALGVLVYVFFGKGTF